MALANKLVSAVQFKGPVDIGGRLVPYVGSGDSHWKGWNIYADYATREILVAAPAIGPATRKRIRVPFENVSWYEPGLVAPKADMEAFAASDAPV